MQPSSSGQFTLWGSVHINNELMVSGMRPYITMIAHRNVLNIDTVLASQEWLHGDVTAGRQGFKVVSLSQINPG